MVDKLYDMGEVRSNEIVPSGEGKKEKYYPSVSLSSKQLPELKGKKFEDSINIYFKGKISGLHEDYDDKSEAMFDIKIMEACVKDGVSKEEYDKMSDEEKDKADEKEVMGE